MKKKIILLFVVLYSGITCMLGQDVMTLRSGEEMEVIVTEVSKYEVWFKKMDNQDGPIYSLPISDIFMIKYPNGNEDIFPTQQIQAQSTPDYKRKDPAVAFLFSVLLPGGGQYYNGETRKGVVMTSVGVLSFVGMAVSAANITLSYDSYYGYYDFDANSGAVAGLVLCALVYAGNSLWSMIDAPISANRINKENSLLSWNIGKNTNLSIQPDINLISYSPMGNTMFSPSYGAKLTLSLR